ADAKRLRAAGHALRIGRRQRQPPGDGNEVAPERVVRHVATALPGACDRGGHAALRADRGRQRVELVLPGRAERRLERRRSQPAEGDLGIELRGRRHRPGAHGRLNGSRQSTVVQVSDLQFTHHDPLAQARMSDITPKEPTQRRAVARCKVFMKPETTIAIANREVKKGDVLAVARIAGIQAAKRTADMIPLCHPLLVGSVSVTFDIGDDHVVVEAYVETVDRPGVEMEALHACATAALTIYDMCKSADRGMTIGELALWE